MSAVAAPGALARLLAAYRSADPLNVYIGTSSLGIVFVVAMSRSFYYNPVTDDQTTLWDCISFQWITKWVKKYPIDGKPMLLADLVGDHRKKMTPYREKFVKLWIASGGKTSGALVRWMAPWWLFTHLIQMPGKYVQFLPAFVISNLLEFLGNPLAPASVGYKLMVLSALRAICEKTSGLAAHLAPNSDGVQPAFLGAQAAIYKKLQTMSPRGRVIISAAEVQTVFSKLDGGKWSWFGGTMNIGLEAASLPLGYFFIYRLFGFAAVVTSIGINFGITAATAKVIAQTEVADKKLRELRKKQEDSLNELAGSLPIWKFYGWADMFIGRLDVLTTELMYAGRWHSFWKALGEVLPLTIGPAAVLISVGIDVALGGKVELVKLLTAGQYIQIISASMTSLQQAWTNWREFAIESKNIDVILALPDAEPLGRSSDGSVNLTAASFGWPAKPPQAYEVTATELSCKPTEGGGEPSMLAKGTTVESVDDQKKDDTVRVRTVDGKTDGYVKLAELKKLPTVKHEDWVAPSPSIADVDLHINQGELVLISGPVAGGKSSLLQSLVGNTERLSGELTVPKSVAFQPQTPILFDQTIRANILFGIAEEDANEDFIQQSLDASTLRMDMDDPESTLHAKRELTGAGQNGSELSGGQQARVALARCFYASLAGSECVILDDPIKALDPATAAKCWESGIKGTLSGKTRVLVVNSQMLQRFATDKAVTRLVLVAKDDDNASGKIVYNGKPGGIPKELAAKLGDGYDIDFSEEAIKKAEAAAEAQAAAEAEKSAAVTATPEMLAAVAAVTKKMQTVKSWPDPYQAWFKGMLQKGDDGIKGIVEGVSKDMAEFKDTDDDFKQKCLLLIIRSDFADLCNEQYPEINGPTPEMVAAAEAVTKKMLTVKSWPDVFQTWFKGMLGKGDDGIKEIVKGVSKDMEEFKEKDDEFKREVMKDLLKSDFAALANEQFPEINGAVAKADGTPAAKKGGGGGGENNEDEENEETKKKKKPFSQTIAGSIIDYCQRQGIWVIFTCGGSFISQAMSLILYNWNEKWASDALNIGFRANYAIAIGLSLAGQLTSLGFKLCYGFGSQAASKKIRTDMNKKLSVLAMPYLWDPKNSTAQLSDLVTKDPSEFEVFAWMPLIISAASLSLGAIVYSRPLLAPIAAAALYLYKFVKAPFGWALRQVYGGLYFESNIKLRKMSGEVFESSPTIRAMGREKEFELMTNDNFYKDLQVGPLVMGAMGRMNFYSMLVDTMWSVVSMSVVISMRGKATPAVAIAVYNQLEQLNSRVGDLLSVNDLCAQKLPDYMRVQDFLAVKECRGKSCIEEDTGIAPVGWPADGSVSMKDVVFHYATDAPSALSGVSIDIQPGEKIGVCGRTGAGKSTLLSILFSLGPLTEGVVKIAGHSLADISCHEVRAQLAIVPQSPTLFNGTIRENLIGGNRNSDEPDDYLLGTLKTCRLEVLAERGLDGTIGTLSDGQKQLFCVARALVRRPKILVLDEATADLDQESANELLRVIADSFADITVISIAHRLNFIRDSDKILVLNAGGTVNAYDTPAKLLEDTEGYFAKQLAEENKSM